MKIMLKPIDGALRFCRQAFSAIVELLLASVSFIIFSILDRLDRILCIVFWALDSLLDPGSSPCYCKQRVNGALPAIQGPTLLSTQSLLRDGGTSFSESTGGLSSPTCVGADSPLETPVINESISSIPLDVACYEMRSSSAITIDDQLSHGKHLHFTPSHANLHAHKGISMLRVRKFFATDGVHYTGVRNAVHNHNKNCLLSIEQLQTANRNQQASLRQKLHVCFQPVYNIVKDGANKLLSPLQANYHFSQAMASRWSDCSCSGCTSWHSDEKESLYVHREGEGSENVIFIHGFLSSSLIWSEKIMPYLSSVARNKYRLFAVDLLGFGKSPKPRSCHYTMADHIKKIEECVLRRYNITSFHLVAHSMGCLVALALGAAHADSVKTITLLAPPYFPAPANEAGASYVLRQVAPRRIWPFTAFGASVMSWYEHVGRGVCLVLCKQHIMWECIISALTLNRISRAAVCDFMQHTHHSAWHIFHNVICREAFAMDDYLSKLEKAGSNIHVFHGKDDVVVPVQCSYQLQTRYATLKLQVLDNVNHFTIIYGREMLFSRNLDSIWNTEGLNAENSREM